MSTVAADATAVPAKGKKKLILIVVAGVVVLAVAAAGALLLLKPNADEDDEFADAGAPAVQSKPLDAKMAPAYVPLEPFTVNLADREADRYAQVAVTLELADPAVADSIKAFMPAIRNNILMVLAHKTARELMERDGKEQLAQEIRRETARGLGMQVADDDAEDDRRSSRRRRGAVPLPVSAVYFSTFIVQ